MERRRVASGGAIILIVLTLVLTGCTQQETTKTAIATAPIEKQNTPIKNFSKEVPKEETYSAFDAPPDPNARAWTQTAGPLGGTVIRMIPHGGTLLASLYSGGIYRLQPDKSWKQIAIGQGVPEVRAFDLVYDQKNPAVLYVPEMIACGAKTTNNGATWSGLCKSMLPGIGADNFNSHTLALDPTDSNIIYIPGHAHDQTSMLVVSTDGGQNWEKRFIFKQHQDFNHILFFNSKMYLATSDSGIYVSSDKGKSWSQLNDGLADSGGARFVIFKNQLYLLGAKIRFNTREGGNLYRLSTDETSWESVKDSGDVTGVGTDGERLYIGTENNELFVSEDGNRFKQKEARGLPPGWISEIVPLGSEVYVGASQSGTYFSSDDGASFHESNTGLKAIATREVYVNPNNANEIYVGTWDRLGFFWSKNGGKGYRNEASGINVLTLKPDPGDFSRVYLGGDGFFAGKISEEESAFIKKNKPGSTASFVKAIEIDPTNSNHILAGVASEVAETPPGEGLWETTDGGTSWKRAKGIGNTAVYSIVFNPADPSIVYASALGEGVFKSTDGGSNFKPVGTEMMKFTYRLAMSPTDPIRLIASSNVFFGQLSTEEQISGKYGGIFQSDDGGHSWKELTAGIRQYQGNGPDDFLPWLYNFGHLPNYEMVLISPKDPNHLIVGHHGENVVETRDGGKTWNKMGAEEMVPSGIHNYAYCLGASTDFKTIYACSCGRGLFKRSLDEK